ncbi:Gfo/Idh/MocA family protein [Dictyobacter formicarum]|uniref:Oxidoreductase n=1 Tax=Dictyobacter formicarum TaxID=2778368 RepID=A0ABQ3VA52_9CHLR|nr:Gfo/Idh/MocA family oxidoreductase [Dictyobacter formicarum]GHO82376.1 oxidoreductase [Dictyobacter formicarum]
MRKVRVAVVGCGKVSEHYLPHLQQSSVVELVAVCDPLIERAQRHAQAYSIEHAFQDIDQMLCEMNFELLVNLTPMPLHASFNRKALEAGRHVWCEKPIATDLKEAQVLLALAQQQGVGLWGAPSGPISPAFQSMAKVLSTGTLGQVYVAHGIFGWSGPTWPGSAWFYQKGGGSLFDLGVYNLTMLTGLLGPAHSVVAMAGTAIQERVIAGEIIPVEADDNTALILDHGNAVYSVIQTGFVYAAQRDDWTIQVIGTNGAMTMGGYAWSPRDVSIYIGDQMKASGQWETVWQGPDGYVFWGGATYIAECLAKGEKPLLSGEHAVHVLEVMLAALRAAKTGHRIQITSTFPWPLLKEGE